MNPLLEYVFKLLRRVNIFLLGLSNHRFLMERVCKVELESLVRQVNSGEIKEKHLIKFLQIRKRLYLANYFAKRLGLKTTSKQLDILEIGPGCGYFSYLCAQLGHRVLAVDRDQSLLFARANKILGVNRQIAEIREDGTYEIIAGKFDLVCSFMLSFDRSYDSQKCWGAETWRTFLDQLIGSNLKPGGRIFLTFTPRFDGNLLSPEILELFSKYNYRRKLDEFLLEPDSHGES